MTCNRINYNNVNNPCFDEFFEMVDAKRVFYDVAFLEQSHNRGAFMSKVVPLFTLINSYIVFTNICLYFYFPKTSLVLVSKQQLWLLLH